MPYGLYLSATGAHAQTRRMESLSNNLANVGTPGFKPQHTILQSRFAELIEQGEVQPGLGGADDIGGGVTVAPEMTQFAIGPMKQTQRDLDFAISDPGQFFVVQKGEEQFLTRAGEFAFDSKGRLVTQNGEQVLGTDGSEIQLEPGVEFTVSRDGRIHQAGESMELMIAKPKSLGDLSHVGGNQFKSLTQFDLVEPAERNVVNGMLEQSGVSPTRAMMDLIETSRVYEANVRMIQNQDSVIGSLISRVLQ